MAPVQPILSLNGRVGSGECNSHHAENEVKLYDLIEDVEIAMLTTVEPGGSLHSRPMAKQEAGENDNFWFFTDKTTSVATNIKAPPH